MIANGMHILPRGKIAAVVTYLEMTQPPPTKALVSHKLEIKHVPQPDLEWYRALFRKVGEEWLWFSRLSISDDQLKHIIHDPKVEIHVLQKEGKEVGLLELNFCKEQECELSYFGLIQSTIATGAGRFLMQAACKRAWSYAPTIQRFHVHTCTLDHPAAVGFYMRSGFKPYKRSVEITDDPRLDGRLSHQAAEWFPVV